MKNILSFLLIIFLSTILNFSCKKKLDETMSNELPKETQTGANTFGALIDGKIFTPKGGFANPGISVVIQYEIVNFTAKNVETGSGIDLPIRNMNKVGEYPIIANDEVGYRSGNDEYFATNGKVVITTYNKESRILSGRFYFVAKQKSTSKIVNVSDGRFDVKFTDY